MVVELDDKSHRSASAQKRDADKDRVLAAAGLPIVRISAAKGYESATLRNQLAAGLVAE